MTEPVLLNLAFLGRPLGVLAYRAGDGAHALEFDREFLASGHELSPFMLPNALFGRGPRIFRPGDTPFVGGLPGLIADCLPDAWGQRLLLQEAPSIRTPIGKLAVIGARGPGAITFSPTLGPELGGEAASVVLAKMARAADALRSAPVKLTGSRINALLAQGGSSLGGAQPKASVHLRIDAEIMDRGEVLVGGSPPPGFSSCILKLARHDDEAEGAVEFAFWLMAREAGIRVPRACLVHDGERRHFAVERFDRFQTSDGRTGRRHVHTLSGLLHRAPADGAIDYDAFIRVSRRLGGIPEAAECFRRAVFNLLATNRDDHGRNNAFQYNAEARTWALAPAFDLTPSVFNGAVGLAWLGRMALPVRFEDLLRLAEAGGISPGNARDIYARVEAATIGGWRRAAATAKVPPAVIAYWETEMRQQTKPLQADARRMPSGHR